jgi:hypothetical protein
MLSFIIGLLGIVAVVAGLYLLAPPLTLVAIGAGLIRLAILREKGDDS